MTRASQPPPLSEEELAELMAPVVGKPAPVVEPPPPMKAPPPKLPESDEAALERLRSAGMVKEEGQGDPPPWTAPAQTLRIVERDGKTSTFEFGTDGGYLSVEWISREVPWIAEREVSRFGVASIASLELVELDPDAG